MVGQITKTGHIGILGTQGTIQSESYPLEIHKIYPEITVNSHACPMWVPLVENNEYNKSGADYFVKKGIDDILQKDNLIDTLILGCTHYPLLLDKIKQYAPKEVNIISQGKYIAESLKDYLYRHPEMDSICSKEGTTKYLTTESAAKFKESATIFLNREVTAERINLD